MMEVTMGRRSTGLTRAKRIERLTLWLGLPLLLILLSLTAGIVNYTPVRHHETAVPAKPAAAEAAPAVDVEPQAPAMPMRSDRLTPLPAAVETIDDLGQELRLEDVPSVS
jgi:hypothetical protein